MERHDKVSSGHPGLDGALDWLRFGDNVVWQVDSLIDYQTMARRFVKQALLDGRKLIYMRFGSHPPILEENEFILFKEVDAAKGFEGFASEVHSIIESEGKKAFYVFDCLTELLDSWHSDLMIGNFFKVSCPFLYELDTIAYFAVMRNAHAYSTVAGIRETTQLLLELYDVNGKLYVHPLKAAGRYSPTMFYPHRLSGSDAWHISSSAEIAELFSSMEQRRERPDYWNALFEAARPALKKPPSEQETEKTKLLPLLMGRQPRMAELFQRFFSLEDLLQIASRSIGSAQIGGKSAGMLLARKILQIEGGDTLSNSLEPHDSFYLGSDVFYTYIVQNGWWNLRMKQKTKKGYFRYAPELRGKLLKGYFPEKMKEEFIRVLEYFGQSPIIIRSSSLLEDNFGNAFAGKYESVFCANQGSPEERYAAFEQAIREVYASMMSEDALRYRMERGLWAEDEQMAILIQRVSGDQFGDYFFPHIAGVGNSSNLYVWDSDIDMNAGMLRMVLGIGTRAVDRTTGDYGKIVTLDKPMRETPMAWEDAWKFSQHEVDVLSLKENSLTSRPIEEVLGLNLKVPFSLFASTGHQAAGVTDRVNGSAPAIADFKRLLGSTEFPSIMKEYLSILARVYKYPVDIEFTANFRSGLKAAINIVQCRPLQTRGLGKRVDVPEVQDDDSFFFSTSGHFMGGNVRLPVDYAIYVRPDAYLEQSLQAKYSVARQIGLLGRELKEKRILLIGPGRLGTTTPSLGVPVHFTEIAHMDAVCELASQSGGFMPELSYGSHFFQDIVESGIFYAAIFDGSPGVSFRSEYVLDRPNRLSDIIPRSSRYEHVIHVAETGGLELYSDIVTQKVVCK